MTADGTDARHNDEQGFSEDWLTLREPVDHIARNSKLHEKLTKWSYQKHGLKIVDLGAGTGSNLRYLLPLLGHHQQWLLLDNDTALLDHLPELLQSWADKKAAVISSGSGSLFIESKGFSARIDTRVIDLANSLDEVPMNGADLLSASALLDLTSEAWLDQLAKKVAFHHCACLFTLNYSGDIKWQPAADSDATVTALLNRHQRGNKGFGPALGPYAGHHLASMLENYGRRTDIGESDWALNDNDEALQRAIIEGWVTAAKEQNGELAPMIDEWYAMRRLCIDQGTSRLSVGHTDILSLP